ncbi:Protein of unknown function [Lentibacillus halodurans]|uniref:DUF1659 domain-containing protein n=1 Tax=Lentibacillus halodurans TaxID=237679 RepID=A0A1I0X666_9BACI|nr:DUF1659 domain-containing protein [Lentibacillus halodurans]SFA96552.1 Protein of unknown function [Lentibacillus halodurans]
MADEQQVSSLFNADFERRGQYDDRGDIYESKSFNNIKPDAAADQLYVIATVIAGLQERPLHTNEPHDGSEILQV